MIASWLRCVYCAKLHAALLFTNTHQQTEACLSSPVSHAGGRLREHLTCFARRRLTTRKLSTLFQASERSHAYGVGEMYGRGLRATSKIRVQRQQKAGLLRSTQVKQLEVEGAAVLF